MSRLTTHYIDDDPLLKGTFLDVNGDNRTPSAVTVEILDDEKNVIVSPTAGTIVGDEVQFQTTDVQVGNFSAYFTATFGAATDTGRINYRVIPKDGVTS